MNLSVSGKNKKFILLIVFTFLLKLSLAAYFSYLGNCDHPELSFGYLAKTSGDTFSYIGSMDNFITEGTYYFWNGVRKVYAGRMPYYGAPYFLFRLFFDKSAAGDLMVLMQIFFDALAAVYFALLCRNVTNRRAGFWTGYLLYLLSFNFFESVLMLSTESFTLSFIVLFFYAFQKWWSGEDKRAVWTANLFLTLAFLLKPYLAPIYLVFAGIYFSRENLLSAGKLKTLLLQAALLGLPAVILLSPWLLRNLLVLHRPIVAQEDLVAGYNETKADKAFRRFAGGWGGDLTFWDASSPACYFKLNPPVRCDFTLPSYSLTDKYTIEDIEDARADYLALQKNFSPEAEKIVVGKFYRLTEIYRSEKPFMFYIGSGFIRARTMLWHTSNYYLPINPGNDCFQSYQLLFKIAQTLVYQFSLFFGTAGVFWLAASRKISLLFPFVPVFLIIFFGFYLWHVEARYFAHAYPVMLLGLTALFSRLFSK